MTAHKRPTLPRRRSGLAVASDTTTVSDSDAGDTATMTITFTGSYNQSKVVARKYNPANNNFTTITLVSKSATTLDGKPALRIVYHITDGGELDQDGAANGTIVDPVGYLGVLLKKADELIAFKAQIADKPTKERHAFIDSKRQEVKQWLHDNKIEIDYLRAII